MRNAPHPLLAREGWPHVVLMVVVSAAVTWIYGWVVAIPLWLLALFVIQFFRDPPRTAPNQPGLVVSPADGRVVFVGPAVDPYRQRDALKISVFMNVFNVHSNRMPVSGRIGESWYTAGRFINAALDKSSTENERNALWIRAEEGFDVVCVQIAGLIARRILCYVTPGDTVQRGQRYGFIRFGSRVDTYLPPEAVAAVKLGDSVYAGTSIIARLGSPT